VFGRAVFLDAKQRMNHTGAINVIVLTIHADAERHGGFGDTNGNESPHYVKDCECPLCQQPTPDALTTTRMTGTELASQFGRCYHAANGSTPSGKAIR
jgi:hypothetical protein